MLTSRNAVELPRLSEIDERPRDSSRKAGHLEDALLVVPVVFLLPVVILLAGSPIALGVRAMLEIVRRFF